MPSIHYFPPAKSLLLKIISNEKGLIRVEGVDLPLDEAFALEVLTPDGDVQVLNASLVDGAAELELGLATKGIHRVRGASHSSNLLRIYIP